MRFFTLLLMLAGLTASGVCAAQSVRKCVDGEGNLTFVQGDCPKTSGQEDIKIHPENRGAFGSRRFPKPVAGLEWVWLESVFDNDIGGVIVRENGDSHEVLTVSGCEALAQYEESFAQVFSATEFGYGPMMLVLPEHQQRCQLLTSTNDRAFGSQAHSPISTSSTSPSMDVVKEQPPVLPPEQPAQPAFDPVRCQQLRHKYDDLNRPCRGLDQCNTKRAAIKDLRRQWNSDRCEGALGMGTY